MGLAALTWRRALPQMGVAGAIRTLGHLRGGAVWDGWLPIFEQNRWWARHALGLALDNALALRQVNDLERHALVGFVQERFDLGLATDRNSRWSYHHGARASFALPPCVFRKVWRLEFGARPSFSARRCPDGLRCRVIVAPCEVLLHPRPRSGCRGFFLYNLWSGWAFRRDRGHVRTQAEVLEMWPGWQKAASECQNDRAADSARRG